MGFYIKLESRSSARNKVSMRVWLEASWQSLMVKISEQKILPRISIVALTRQFFLMILNSWKKSFLTCTIFRKRWKTLYWIMWLWRRRWLFLFSMQENRDTGCRFISYRKIGRSMVRMAVKNTSFPMKKMQKMSLQKSWTMKRTAAVCQTGMICLSSAWIPEVLFMNAG